VCSSDLKTVTLTTVNRTVSTGSIRRFADGGITGLGAMASLIPTGAVRETPGQAKIYQPVTPGRFFAEAVTGGEAYIPLAGSKRGMAIPTWLETGKLLGILANGGIQTLSPIAPGGLAGFGGTQILFSPNVTIELSGLGAMDVSEVAPLVESAVGRALAQTAQELENSRRR